jgi:formate dehydrogenase major subunit
VQPEFFVEISEELAKAKGIRAGGWVRVWSHRGSVKGKAVITKRLKPLQVDGKTVHVVGLPLNFGFIDETKKATPINALTPPAGNANAQTPEFRPSRSMSSPSPGRWHRERREHTCFLRSQTPPRPRSRRA